MNGVHVRSLRSYRVTEKREAVLNLAVPRERQPPIRARGLPLEWHRPWENRDTEAAHWYIRSTLSAAASPGIVAWIRMRPRLVLWNVNPAEQP